MTEGGDDASPAPRSGYPAGMPNRWSNGLTVLALGIVLAACRAGEGPGAGDPPAERDVALTHSSETSPAALPEIRYYEIADT